MPDLQKLTVMVVMVTIIGCGHLTSSFVVTECSTGSCILLKQCPELLKLLRPPSRESIKKLQSLTCGFDGPRQPKVCCPTVEEVTPSPPSEGEALLAETCGHNAPLDKLFGAIEAPLGGYPWMAVLGYTNVVRGTLTETVWECGGSLINNRYVLTAAHCTNRGLPLTKVRLGENHLLRDLDCTGDICAPTPLEFTPIEVIRHPNYSKRGFASDDLALIRLERPVQFSAFIQPVCLPSPGQLFSDIAAGRSNVTVTGWGDTEFGNRSQQLLQVALPVVPESDCRTVLDYNTRLIEGGGQLCFGGGVGQDSCDKDSGGPAVMTKGVHGPPYVQVGVVSYGPVLCGTESIPGVYTDVAYYRSWIVDNLKP